MLSTLTIICCFALGMFLTGRVKQFLERRRALIDIPNDRSSHNVPVPRGGGWAILAVLVPVLFGSIAFVDGNLKHLGLAFAVCLLAFVSWLDDRNHVNSGLRLVVHVFAAWLGTLTFSDSETLFGSAVPLWIDRTVMVLAWAWFINLYNFMDGIDGITAVETICIAVGVCIVMDAGAVQDMYVSVVKQVLIGLCLGFLAYNWHPAKIFLGDAGSVPLGYISGFFLLTIAVKGYWASAFVIPLYYIADSGITIAKRALRGEKVWQAHREHFYQKAALGARRHDKVVYIILFANICLLGAAAGGVANPYGALGAGTLIVAVLLAKLHKLGSVPVLSRADP